MGRGDHADVHEHRWGVGADRLQFAVLEKAEEQGLHADAHLGNLVEKDRPAVRLLKLADLVSVRPGEAATHVSEQL